MNRTPKLFFNKETFKINTPKINEKLCLFSKKEMKIVNLIFSDSQMEHNPNALLSQHEIIKDIQFTKSNFLNIKSFTFFLILRYYHH